MWISSCGGLIIADAAQNRKTEPNLNPYTAASPCARSRACATILAKQRGHAQDRQEEVRL